MSATESQFIPNPEENPIGFDLDGLSFTMPKIGEREITTTTLFSFKSLLAVMESRAGIADDKTASLVVSFVGANSIAGYAVNVTVSELFDMAVADMLDAIGDVDMKTADRALNDAQRDPTKLGKHRHRMMAEKSLGMHTRSFNPLSTHGKGSGLIGSLGTGIIKFVQSAERL